MYPYYKRLLGFLTLLLSSFAKGAILVQALGGLMQQPNSQFFHATTGAALTITGTPYNLLGSLTFTERPRFSANGYRDQEQGLFATFGRSIPLRPHWQLLAGLGVGQQQGSIVHEAQGERQGYILSGLASKVELLYTYAALSLSVNHQVFVGFDSGDQLESYVAWPFNYFNLGCGVQW